MLQPMKSPGCHLRTVFATALFLGATALLHGDGLNSALEPNFGKVTLRAGFAPDPHTVQLISGGIIDADKRGYGSGFTSEAPDLNLYYDGSADNLRIFFIPEGGNGDTTLIVNDPNGDWHSNDDAGEGLHPMVGFSNAQSGRYDIWVGSYSRGERVPGTLYITERNLTPDNYATAQPTEPETTTGTSDAPASATRLSPSSDPNFGVVKLSSGFQPSPHQIRITSGGTIDASELNLDPHVSGYTTSAPDVRLQWAGSSEYLRIYFEAEDEDGDTTLIVSAPDGVWHGNDDTDDLNPVLRFHQPLVGTYDIWIGSYDEEQNVIGTLYITEAPEEDLEGRLMPGDAPNFGSRSLSAGFRPDPVEIHITSGGSVDAARTGQGNNLYGNMTSNPDFELDWSGDADQLRFFFLPDDTSGDTTLVISDPYGRLYGNDDYQDLHPLIEFIAPIAGKYDVWVGSYAENENVEGTLYITTQPDLGPLNLQPSGK